MRKLFVFLALALFTLLPFSASAAILVYSADGSSVAKPTLESTRTALESSNKTVVITTALTVAQSNLSGPWPADRRLEIRKGGVLNNTTAVTIAGPFEAGRYTVFKGSGAVILSGVSTPQIFPEWWGAAGDNQTTSATINVTAINAALAVANGTLLPVSLTGTYYINGQITPGSNSKLISDGSGVLKAVPSISGIAAGDYLISVNGQTNFNIDRVEVDGNRTNQTQDSGHAFGGVIFLNSTNCAITNSRVHDMNGQLTGGAVGNGIRTWQSGNILIANNAIYSNNGCGMNLFFSSANITVIGNRIWNNTEIGIESEGRNGTDYTNYRNSQLTIANNHILGKSDVSRLDDHSILLDWTDSSTITGNFCGYNNHNGIEVLGAHEITITGNMCVNNGDTGAPYIWAGIKVTAEGFGESGRCMNITVTGNQVSTSQYGIHIDTAYYVIVNGNNVTAVPNSAMRLDGGNYELNITNNDLTSTADTILLNNTDITHVAISGNKIRSSAPYNGILYFTDNVNTRTMSDFRITDNMFIGNNNGIFCFKFANFTNGQITRNTFNAITAADLNGDAGNPPTFSHVYVGENTYNQGPGAYFPAFGIPSSGTWSYGDRRTVVAPAAGDYTGYIYTSTGWKGYGAVAP